MFDEEHAVMFGGYSPGSGNSADAYVLHVPTMVSGLLLHTINSFSINSFSLSSASFNIWFHM